MNAATGGPVGRRAGTPRSRAPGAARAASSGRGSAAGSAAAASGAGGPGGGGPEGAGSAGGGREARTSAEIRVHLDARCPGDPMAQAVKVFERLGMHRTAGRHGVMIYVAVGGRRLAVVGDAGIHGRVGEEYWQRLLDASTSH